MSHAKDSTKHWLGRLQKRGKNPNWFIRPRYRMTQKWVNLQTGNKSLAAERAVRFWKALTKNNLWEDAFEAIEQQSPAARDVATVGQWIEAFLSTFVDVDPRTINVYAGCLRRIASEIANVTHEDFPRREDWREAADAISLSVLSKETVEGHIRRQLHDVSREQLFSRRRSLHSNLRNARNLFTERRRTKLTSLILPSPAPFEGVDIQPWKPQRYRSSLNVPLLLKAGKDSLPGDQFLVLVLAACAGLRKEEIDKLLWQQVRFDKPSISIERTWCYNPKSESSCRVVPIADDVAVCLREHGAAGDFVLPGQHPNIGATYYNYRAAKTFVALGKWLRSKGVTDRQPIHALRKEYGSRINEIAGLKAASEALGHSEIGITASTYVENRERVVVSLDG